MISLLIFFMNVLAITTIIIDGIFGIFKERFVDFRIVFDFFCRYYCSSLISKVTLALA